MKKPLIIIAGPTASGKTKSSVLLAKQINGEIISADSMQVYRQMDIGTAKVKKEEMDGIPHYMIDVLDPSEACNVSWFKNQVTAHIEEISSRGKVPILVGGTGFYLNAILYDTQFEETQEDTSYREQLNVLAQQKGAEAIHEMLRAVDPESAEAIHPNNTKRVIRALEYYHQTGQRISEHNAEEKSKRITKESPYDFAFFALNMGRSALYERINMRVDQMIDEGLVSEVSYFFNEGYQEDLTSMKAIGYKEFYPYFRGEMCLEDCIDKLKQNTRHYAKRQLTWFKHQAHPHFVPVDELGYNAEAIVQEMLKNISSLYNRPKICT
ncbi:MAG: tRNA (adenosine(37)-N6)-dimethylallyltransferase MiaA [Cellulosilyticaceae bacterium]